MFDPSCRVDVALRSHRNLYVTALTQANGWYLAGVSKRVLGWENFTLLRLSNHEVALKTAHGKYVTAFPAEDGWSLRGRADRILGWEIFRIHYLSGERDEAFGRGGASRELAVALETHHGKWVRGGGAEQGFRLSADSAELSADCKFTMRLL